MRSGQYQLLRAASQSFRPLNIGPWVWTVLKEETLRIQCGKEEIAGYRVKIDYLKTLAHDS